MDSITMSPSIMIALLILSVAISGFVIFMMFQDNKKFGKWQAAQNKREEERQKLIDSIQEHQDSIEKIILEMMETMPNGDGHKKLPVSKLVVSGKATPPPREPTMTERIYQLLRERPLSKDIIVEKLSEYGNQRQIITALGYGKPSDPFIRDESGLWSVKE